MDITTGTPRECLITVMSVLEEVERGLCRIIGQEEEEEGDVEVTNTLFILFDLCM